MGVNRLVMGTSNAIFNLSIRMTKTIFEMCLGAEWAQIGHHLGTAEKLDFAEVGSLI